MTYETAKKLKDGGFKLRRCEYAHSFDSESPNIGECAYCSQPAFIIGKDHYIIPTLSELIEACGGSAKALIQQDNSTKWEYAVDGIGAFGDTPEEAVANLYLALNKK